MEGKKFGRLDTSTTLVLLYIRFFSFFLSFVSKSFPMVVVSVLLHGTRSAEAPPIYSLALTMMEYSSNQTNEKQDVLTKWFRRFSIFRRECWKCFNHKETEQTKGKIWSISFICFVLLSSCFFFLFVREYRRKRERWSMSAIYRNLVKAQRNIGWEFSWNISSTLLRDPLVSCPCGLRFLWNLFLFFDADCLVIILFEIHSEGKKRCDSQREIEKDRKHFFCFLSERRRTVLVLLLDFT